MAIVMKHYDRGTIIELSLYRLSRTCELYDRQMMKMTNQLHMAIQRV